MERDAVALIGDQHNFGPERGADELRLLRFGNGIKQRRDGRAVLRVQVGVDLVENNKGRGLGGLQGED